MLVLLYLGSMWGYIRLRRKFADQRYSAELITLALVALFVTIVRFIFLGIPDVSMVINFADKALYIASHFWLAIYTTFGAFQFEGLPETIALTNGFQHYIFLASSVYAGLMLISVITATISYEIYSLFRLFFARKSNSDVYVFTHLNNDTLTLAKSISAHHEKKGERYLIIFSGHNLKPFNRHDALCIEVTKHSFLYYSHRRKEGTALLKILGLLKPKRKVSIFERKRVHLFAFAQTDENNVADETININTIFDELRDVFTYFKARAHKNFINRIYRFYVLTRDDLLYEKYENEKKKILNEVFNGQISGKMRTFISETFNVNETDETKYNKRLLNHFNSLFNLHIINEATLTARAFSYKRSVILNENKVLRADVLQQDDMYQALFLGFGKTNEKVLNQLYIDTAAVNTALEEIHFSATIVDDNLNKRIGVYSAEHPYYIVLEHHDDSLFHSVSSIRDLFNIKMPHPLNKTKLVNRYLDVVGDIAKKDYGLKKIPHIKLPLISYFEESCTSDRFLQLLDRSTGDQKGSFHSFNTIVIALGNDDDNIKLANVIINDARKELLRAKSALVSPQLIAVHISDRHNYFKLQQATSDNEEENAKLTGLNVIAFGDVSELYSYENIVDDAFAKVVNTGYDIMSSYIYNATEQVKANFNSENKDHNLSFKAAYHELKALDSAISDDFNKTSTYLFNKIGNAGANEKAWLKNDGFKKESNAQVLLYELTAKALIAENIDPALQIEWLSMIEHVRWNRLYIANGWRFSSERNDAFLRHDCITSLDLVPSLKNLYDIVNIALLHNIDKLRS